MNVQEKESLDESQVIRYPRAYCAYHPQNIVLNFCRNPICLMPLCQECIKIHQQEHYVNGTYAQFETIDDVQKEVTSNLESLQMKYKQHKTKQINYQTKLSEHDTVLYDQIKIARAKVNEVIDKFFSALHLEILEKQNICKEKQELKLNEHNKIINEKSQNIDNILKKLQGEHFLKYIIEFLNSTANTDEMTFEKESNATLSIFNVQLMDIILDETKLKEINKNLNSYININNGYLYDQKIQSHPSKINKQQSLSKIVQSQQPIQQQLTMLPSPTLQTSTIPQQYNYYRNSSMSPTRAIHSPMQSQNIAQTSFQNILSARQQQSIEKKKKKNYKGGLDVLQSKMYYPNNTMCQSWKYVQK